MTAAVGWETTQGLLTHWDSLADSSHQLSQVYNYLPGDGPRRGHYGLEKNTPAVNASMSAPLLHLCLVSRGQESDSARSSHSRPSPAL